jgi:HSP20 family protein
LDGGKDSTDKEVEMSTVTRMRNSALAPFDWPNLSWFPLLTPSIRIEEHIDGDRYTVRAELPGIDPDKDLRVTRLGDELRIDVVRKDSNSDKGRSEFHYGAFYRAVPLPAGTRPDTIIANYVDGILELTATVGPPESAAKEIPIQIAGDRKH